MSQEEGPAYNANNGALQVCPHADTMALVENEIVNLDNFDIWRG
jgi:hypothetical protein